MEKGIPTHAFASGKSVRDEIIRAAVELVDEQGMNALTARNVAFRLGASTAPVYYHFANMKELASCVIGETEKAMLEYTNRPYTDRVFLNMGTGIAMFATEHPLLYRALMLEGPNYGDVVQEILGILDSGLKKDTRFTLLPDSERSVFLRKMWTFTHGLASLISVGLIKDSNQEYIVNTLLDIGGDVIGSTLAKFQNSKKGE